MGLIDVVAKYIKEIIVLALLIAIFTIIAYMFSHYSIAYLCRLSCKVRDTWMDICLISIGEVKHFCIGDYIQFPLIGCAPSKIKVNTRKDFLERVSLGIYECAQMYGTNKLDVLWSPDENPAICLEIYGSIGGSNFTPKDITYFLENTYVQGKSIDCTLMYQGKVCCPEGYFCNPSDKASCMKEEKSPWKCQEKESSYLPLACKTENHNGILEMRSTNKEDCLKILKDYVNCGFYTFSENYGCISCPSGYFLGKYQGGEKCVMCEEGFEYDEDYGKCVKCLPTPIDIAQGKSCFWNSTANKCTCGILSERVPDVQDPTIVKSIDDLISNPCESGFSYDASREKCYKCEDSCSYNKTLGLCECTKDNEILYENPTFEEPLWPIYLYDDTTGICYYCNESSAIYLPNYCILLEKANESCIGQNVSIMNFLKQNNIGLVYSFSNTQFNKECTKDTCKLIGDLNYSNYDYYATGKVKVFIEYLDSFTLSRKNPEVRELPKECAVGKFLDSCSACKSCITATSEALGGSVLAKVTSIVGGGMFFGNIFWWGLEGATAHDIVECTQCMESLLTEDISLAACSDTILVCVVDVNEE